MDTHKNAPLTRNGRGAIVPSVIVRWRDEDCSALQFHQTAKRSAKKAWMDRDRCIRHLATPSQTLAATCPEVGAFYDRVAQVKQIATEATAAPRGALCGRLCWLNAADRQRNTGVANPVA